VANTLEQGANTKVSLYELFQTSDVLKTSDVLPELILWGSRTRVFG